MVDREAQKLDDKLKRDFTSEELDRKAVTDITEIKCKAGKLFLSAVFDCFNLMVQIATPPGQQGRNSRSADAIITGQLRTHSRSVHKSPL